MAPHNLTLNGLYDSAESTDEFIITHVSKRTEGNDTANGNVVIVSGVEKDPAHIGNITKNIYNSVNDSDDNNSRGKDKSVNAIDIDSGNVVIVFGVGKDPTHIGNITKNICNSVHDSDDNNSRGKDKSVNANEIDSGNVVFVFGVERDPTHVGDITKNIDNNINDGNDNNINSRRKVKSAIGVIDHAVSDVMQPNCVEFHGNDTASNDAISVTGVGKDPVNISSVNNNVNNSMNDNSDNKIRVIIMDFGLEPPSNVSHVTYSTRGCGVGAVADLAIRKQSCLSGSSDADSFVFALSL